MLLALLTFRYLEGDGRSSSVLPENSFHTDVIVEFSGHGSAVSVSMLRPQSNDRQSIFDEQVITDGLVHTVHRLEDNEVSTWEARSINGSREIGYSFGFIGETRKYIIPAQLKIHQEIPDDARGYLVADEYTQSDDPAVLNLANHLGLDTLPTIEPAVHRIFDYATDSLDYINYSGTTDAVTALKLGEASCGGKSRLFVALCRAIGIPSRLVGGKIMHPGKNRVMHVWTECWINGYWVPFCPTNRYYAEIPSYYAQFYIGDEPFLSHTEDIGFKYSMFTKERLVSREDINSPKKVAKAATFDLWSVFRRAAVSVELLRIILMLPLGALVVVLFRNVIGLQTFGTFMPALVAIGFRDTGLWWGLVAFAAVILVGLLVRAVLERLQLTHTPRLAILLTFVVGLLLTVASFATSMSLLDLARVSMFPMVIMTMTVERCSLVANESGLAAAIRVSASTAVVAAAAYFAMETPFLQSILVGYPEMMLAVIIANIFLGRYTGLRLTELWRFRALAPTK